MTTQEAPVDAAERFSRSWRDRFAQLRWLLFSFSGRIKRSTFLFSMVLVYAVPVAVYVLAVLILDSGILAIGGSVSETFSETAEIAGLVFAIPLFAWINLAVTFKRLHDYGASLGMFLTINIVSIIPFIGPVIGLFLLFRSGDSGANMYGNGPGWRADQEPLDVNSTLGLSLR